MPLIPISTDVGGADLNTGAQGIVGQAMANTGATLASVGFDLVERMTKAEAVEEYNSRMAQLEIKTHAKKKSLEMSSLGGYMVDDKQAFIMNKAEPGQTPTRRTITEEFRDWANEEFRTGQLQMPNRLGQKMFQQGGMKHLTDEINDISSAQLVKRVEYATEQRKTWQKLAGNAIETKPDIDFTHEQLGALALRLRDSVEAESLSENNYAEELRVVSNDFAVKQIVGEINKIKQGQTIAEIANPIPGKPPIAKGPVGTIDDLLSILNRAKRDPLNPNVIDPTNEIGRREKDYMLPSIDKALFPEPRNAFIDELLMLKRSYVEKSSSDFKFKVADMSKAAERGKFSSPESLSSLWGQARQEIQNGRTAQEVVGDLISVEKGHALGRLLPLYTGDANTFGGPSTKQQVSRLKKEEENLRSFAARAAAEFNDGSIDPKTVGGSEIADLHDKLDAAIAKNQSEYHAAPATYLAKSDPEAKRILETINLGDRRSFTPESAAKIQQVLTRIENGIKARATVGERTKNEVIPEGLTNTLGSIKTTLTDSRQGVDEGIQYMDALRGQLGDKFYLKTLDQLTEQDKSLEDYNLVQYMNTPTEKRAALKLAWDGSKMQSEFIKTKGQDAWVEVVQAVADKTDPITRSLFKHDADNTIDRNKQDAFNRVLAYQAAELVRSGKSNSAKNAATTVYNQFIARHFEVTKVGGAFWTNNGDKTEIVIPKYLPDGSPLSPGDIEKLKDFGDRPLEEEMAQVKIKMPGENEMQSITPEHFKETLTKSNYVARAFGKDPNGSGQIGWSLRYILRGPEGNEVSRIPLRVDTGKPTAQEQIYFIPVRKSILEQNKRMAK